jgi:UMF1 family MFS transporter
MWDCASSDEGRFAMQLETPAAGRFAWALYDWANSPFTTLVITFVFPAYFQQGIVKDPVAGQALWGTAIAVSGILIAIGAPIAGAIADAAGRRKPWLLAFTLLCTLGSLALWFATPEPAAAMLCLIAVVIANIGFEFGVVFNNAMLPDIVPEERLGRLSGWAWGFGYAGGLAALVVALAVFIWPKPPLFGLDAAAAEEVRITGPLVGIWLLVFALPLFLLTPDRQGKAVPLRDALRLGLADLGRTLKALPRQRSVLPFLIAHMIYGDGLVTLFAFGGVYAAGAFGMSLAQVIVFGIVLNVAAGLGAFAFAWLDDRLGSKRVVVLALIGLIAASSLAVAATRVTGLWIAGTLIGVFIGPAQAASRSLMARLTEPETRAAAFGLYALTGKATAFVGPAMVAAVTAATGSQRAGIATIIVFFAIGLALLTRVKEPGR